jgi:hypothetical protein
MENNAQTLADAFNQQYEGVEPVADREEAFTGTANEWEAEEAPVQTEEETTEEPVAEAQEEENREEENVAEEEQSTDATEQESSLNSEESSTEESNETAQQSTFDFDAEFAKRTEGRFNSIDEMMEAVNTQSEQTKFEYGNELIAKLDELAKQGVNVDLDFVQSQMVDYSAYDVENTQQALELIKKQFKLDEPDITERELKFELSERYKLDEDMYDEDDIERSKMRLMRDAKRARKALEDNQKNTALPKGGVDPEKQRQAEEQARQAQEKLNKTLQDGLSRFEKESITVGNETFDYKLTSEVKKTLENTIMNTHTYFNQYLNKDGSVNVDKLNSDQLWANSQTREIMLKSFLQQATAKGSKDVVNDIKNTSFDGKTPKAQGSDNSQSAQIARHFEQKYKR